MAKVHGSLARAGKVKGQTQKKEKMEKHKPKCGRSRMRLLYTRRFENPKLVNGKLRYNSNAEV